MSMEKISIDYIQTDLLKPYPGNPRDCDDKGKSDLKKSIRKFGWTNPLLINMASGREFIVLSGNLRLTVAKELKIPEIPCIKTMIADPNREKEIVLRMNVLNGIFNDDILRDWGIDLAIEAGLPEVDISAVWDNSLETEDDDFKVDEERAKIIKPKTKLGEIYKLGHHTLGCGNATDKEFVKKVMNGQLADVIYCDPPFNISLNYNKGLGGKSSYGGKTNDSLSDADYKTFLKSTIENALSVAKPDCHIFYYCDQKFIGLLQEIYRELGIENKRVCLWAKNGMNPTPGVAFNKSYEPCVYGVKGKPYLSPKCSNFTEFLNKEIATGNRQLDDIFDLWDIWLVKRLAGQDYSHPTEKPITLHEKALRRCSKVNDVVLDLFSGSFSTGAACEQLKRRIITIDMEPTFCDLAIARFKNLTGQDAKLISGGQNGK